MSLDLLNTDPKQFLDALKTAYYEQTGETLQIGSDYFAVSSVYAYCLAVFFNAVNSATQNRFIDYATGEYLDAIAANYGIESRPDGYHATAEFSISLIQGLTSATFPPGSIVISDGSGNKFTNRYAVKITSPNSTTILYSQNPGTQYNGIPANSLTTVESGEYYISSATNTVITSGGTDGFPYTTDGDNQYRTWLKNEIKSFSGAGTYAAYEARARNADPRVSDVYVLRQEDEGYQKGKVKIFIYCKEYMSYDIGQDQVVSIVQNACSDESFRPIGDLVEVEYSQLYTAYISGSGAFVVTYPEKFRTFANNRNARILNEYKNEVKNYINKPFVGEELCARLVATDDDGVYALDARTNTGFIYPSLIYPPIGKRLAVSGPQMQSVFVDRG